jgi:hypothetical protein
MPTPDFTVGKTRTNPQAHNPNNAVQLYGIRKIGDCSFSPTWNWAYTVSNNRFTCTPATGQNTSGLRYWKLRIVDEDGVEAAAAMSVSSPAAFFVSTATLDPLKKWSVHFSAEVRSGGKSCIAEWWFDLPAGTARADASGSGQNV